jgi:hypothetical protein
MTINRIRREAKKTDGRIISTVRRSQLDGNMIDGLCNNIDPFVGFYKGSVEFANSQIVEDIPEEFTEHVFEMCHNVVVAHADRRVPVSEIQKTKRNGFGAFSRHVVVIASERKDVSMTLFFVRWRKGQVTHSSFPLFCHSI